MSADPALMALLQDGIERLGLALGAPIVERLIAYQAELEKWNGAYNLTAVRDPQQMVVRHLLDSLSVLPHVRGRVLDVGAGAGLPGLVLAIANPDLAVTVLDSNGKKVRFMRHAVRTLGIVNADVVEARIEQFRPGPAYDCIVSRAFAALADFVTPTAPLLAAGGQWVAMKGKLDPLELAGLPAEVRIRETVRLQVPGLNEDRHALIAERKT